MNRAGNLVDRADEDLTASEGKHALAGDKWVDRLLPVGDRLFDAVSDLSLSDRGQKVRLGAIDQSIAAVLFSMMREGGTGRSPKTLLIHVPRAAQDIAMLVGILAQLGRKYANLTAPGSCADLGGSVVIVGMDTAVQEKLGGISIERVALSEGLEVHRVRSDARLVRPSGEIVSFHPGVQRVLFLNTRVGWPRLKGEEDGLAVIDRTSFRSPEILRTAIKWSLSHSVRHLVVISDQGDMESEDIVRELDPSALIWSVIPELSSTLVRVVGTEATRSPFSTNVLLNRSGVKLRVTEIAALQIEQLFRECYDLLRRAREVDELLPYPLAAARRTLNVLNQLLGTGHSYNLAAALDHRSKSLRSLETAVHDVHASAFSGAWRSFAATRWARLRDSTLELLRIVNEDNPKFFGLLVTLDRLPREFPGRPIRVRVGSEAAASALIDDLLGFDIDATQGQISIAPWNKRLPSCETDALEILPAVPPLSRRAQLWSSEATDRFVILYEWERRFLDRLVRADRAGDQENLSRAFLSLNLGPAPVLGEAVVETFDRVRMGGRIDPQSGERGFEVDLEALTSDLEGLAVATEDDGQGGESTPTSSGSFATGVGIELMSGSIWWVRAGSLVERLIGDRYHRTSLEHLEAGNTVIIPRGTGRDELFTRLVAAKHRDQDVQDLMDVLARWRRACRSVIEKCGNDPAVVERELVAAHCSVTSRLYSWADGTTIGPEDDRDIERVAMIAGDEWLTRNWRRIARIASELRGLHISIGQRISGALREVEVGEGPNLSALARLLGTDASEILDEFDIATVNRILAPREIAGSLIGRVVDSEETI